MTAKSVTATVRTDGALEIPPETSEELHLKPGDLLELEVRKMLLDEDPLLRIIGLGDGRPDGSVNHDAYLYGGSSK